MAGGGAAGPPSRELESRGVVSPRGDMSSLVSSGLFTSEPETRVPEEHESHGTALFHCKHRGPGRREASPESPCPPRFSSVFLGPFSPRLWAGLLRSCPLFVCTCPRHQWCPRERPERPLGCGVSLPLGGCEVPAAWGLCWSLVLRSKD